MFKVGDRIIASDDIMMRYKSKSIIHRYTDLYNATVNNEEMVVKFVDGTLIFVYCESFTCLDKTYIYLRHKLQLYKNDGKLRFTYSEVPSGTEYSYFKEWSRRHK